MLSVNGNCAIISRMAEDLVTAWLRTQSSPNTLAAYRADIALFGKWCAARGAVPLAADTKMLMAFQGARAKIGDSPSTLRRRWSSLSSFYDFAVSRRAVEANPARGADRPRVDPGNPSPTAQLSARAVAERRSAAAQLDPRLDVLFSLLVADGLKLGEALALDLDHISGRPPKVTITVQRRGLPHRVMLHADSAHAIRRYVGSRRAGPLFLSERSSRLTRFGADHLLRQLRVTANELRRYHITTSHRTSRDSDAVRERAGLADVRSVHRYLAGTQS